MTILLLRGEGIYFSHFYTTGFEILNQRKCITHGAKIYFCEVPWGLSMMASPFFLFYVISIYPPSIFILPHSSYFFHTPLITYIPQYLFPPLSVDSYFHFHTHSFSSLAFVHQHRLSSHNHLSPLSHCGGYFPSRAIGRSIHTTSESREMRGM